MAQIKVSNLTFAYEGSYDNVFENVSFVIDTDWRLGFTGRNGRGKTTFLNALSDFGPLRLFPTGNRRKLCFPFCFPGTIIFF